MTPDGFKYLINRTEKHYTFGVYGVIGVDVDGHQLAQEISFASELADVINIHINSEGGSVMHGLSIFAAIRNSTAKVNIIIDGVAASMAGVIAMAGSEVSMVDYGRLMIHDPSFKDQSKLSEKDKKAITNIRDMLVSIFTNKRGKDEAWVSSVMEEETWFTSSKALEEKLIDKIIATGKIINYAGYTVSDLVALSKKTNNQNEISMKKIALKLGLDENSTEDQLVAKIETILNQAKESNENAVKVFIAQGTALGVINDDNKAKFEKLANTDFELATQLLENFASVQDVDPEDKKKEPIPGKTIEQPIRLSDLVKELKNQSNVTTDPEKDYEYYMKNDSAALRQMEANEPAKFKKLYDAWCDK